jgi:uncharacterized membrane protein
MSETRKKIQKKSETLRKRKTTKQKDKFANTFSWALFCFQVLQVIMQIRFATAGKKKNISEALRKTQTKSRTLRKKRTTKHKVTHSQVTG